MQDTALVQAHVNGIWMLSLLSLTLIYKVAVVNVAYCCVCCGCGPSLHFISHGTSDTAISASADGLVKPKTFGLLL